MERATALADVPPYYVSAGRKNVKLNQSDISVDRPALPFGPFSANDGRGRIVTVFATSGTSAAAILSDWQARWCK